MSRAASSPFHLPRSTDPALLLPDRAAENANISMDVSVELAAPPTLPASSSGSGAGFGGLYERRGVHRGPYYSDARDVPRQAREYAGRLWAFGTHAREEDEEPLDDVYARQHGTFLGKADEQVLARRLKRKRRAVEATDDEEARQQQEQPAAAAARWEFGFRAVTRGEAEAWLATEQTEEKKRRKHFLESQVRPAHSLRSSRRVPLLTPMLRCPPNASSTPARLRKTRRASSSARSTRRPATARSASCRSWCSRSSVRLSSAPARASSPAGR